MVHTCVALGCHNRKTDGSLLSFYRFPRDKERKQLWIAAVKREVWRPTEHSRLCSEHFISGKQNKNPRSPDYVPSIFKHETSELKMKRSTTSENQYKTPSKSLQEHENKLAQGHMEILSAQVPSFDSVTSDGTAIKVNKSSDVDRLAKLGVVHAVTSDGTYIKFEKSSKFDGVDILYTATLDDTAIKKEIIFSDVGVILPDTSPTSEALQSQCKDEPCRDPVIERHESPKDLCNARPFLPDCKVELTDLRLLKSAVVSKGDVSNICKAGLPLKNKITKKIAKLNGQKYSSKETAEEMDLETSSSTDERAGATTARRCETNDNNQSSDGQQACGKRVRGYKCRYCNHVCTTKPELVDHEHVHNPYSPYTCLFCGRSFAYRSNAERTNHVCTHKKIPSRNRPFKCHFCSRTFAAKPHLATHLRRVHDADKLLQVISPDHPDQDSVNGKWVNPAVKILLARLAGTGNAGPVASSVVKNQHGLESCAADLPCSTGQALPPKNTLGSTGQALPPKNTGSTGQAVPPKNTLGSTGRAVSPKNTGSTGQAVTPKNTLGDKNRPAKKPVVLTFPGPSAPIGSVKSVAVKEEVVAAGHGGNVPKSIIVCSTVRTSIHDPSTVPYSLKVTSTVPRSLMVTSAVPKSSIAPSNMPTSTVAPSTTNLSTVVPNIALKSTTTTLLQNGTGIQKTIKSIIVKKCVTPVLPNLSVVTSQGQAPVTGDEIPVMALVDNQSFPIPTTLTPLHIPSRLLVANSKVIEMPAMRATNGQAIQPLKMQQPSMLPVNPVVTVTHRVMPDESLHNMQVTVKVEDVDTDDSDCRPGMLVDLKSEDVQSETMMLVDVKSEDVQSDAMMLVDVKSEDVQSDTMMSVDVKSEDVQSLSGSDSEFCGIDSNGVAVSKQEKEAAETLLFLRNSSLADTTKKLFKCFICKSQFETVTMWSRHSEGCKRLGTRSTKTKMQLDETDNQLVLQDVVKDESQNCSTEKQPVTLPLDDEKILQVTTRELKDFFNSSGLPEEVVQAVKRRRRALKSRVYSIASRMKHKCALYRLEHTVQQLKEEYKELLKEQATLCRDLTKTNKELEKYDQADGVKEESLH